MEYILIGDSGHAKVIRESIEASGDRVKAILDDKYLEVFKVQQVIKGPISYLHDLKEETDKVIIAIGNNKIREKIACQLQLHAVQYGIVIHPTAIVSKSSKIAPGTVVMPKVVINADANIGQHTILNTSSVIEHDVLIEDFVHIAPGAVIAGGAKIGMQSHIGPNATVDVLAKIQPYTHVPAGGVMLKVD